MLCPLRVRLNVPKIRGVNEQRDQQEYSRRVYRYATPSAINISGKVDDVGRVERHSGESPEPGIYNETKKGTPSVLLHVVLFVFVSPPLVPSFFFSYPLLTSSFQPPISIPPNLPPFHHHYRTTRCLTCPTSKFTLYRRSTKPPSPFRALLKIEDAICLAALRRRPTCSK
ncbi:hypothetical protein ANTRET_LOCUS6340 [Anthophora retusa]